MYFPSFLFVADILLWWLTEDVQTRWADLTITTSVAMLAFIVLIMSVHETYLLLRSDDPEDD